MRRTSFEYEEPRKSFGARLASGLRRSAVATLSLVLIPGLLIVALLLPPISLVERIQFLSYSAVDNSGGTLMDSDMTSIIFPPENVIESFRASLESIPRIEFENGAAGENWIVARDALTPGLLPKSPIYEVDVQGGSVNHSILQIPIPNDSQPYETLELYSWDGDSWEFVPSSVSGDLIEARVDGMPLPNFVVMQTSAPPPRVGTNIGLGDQTPPNLADAAITTLAFAGFYLRGDGALDTVPRNPVSGNYAVVPVLRNWQGGEVPRSDLLHNMLVDQGQLENQLNAVTALLTANNYPGVIIDYRGMDAAPAGEGEFSYFIERLAERLHAPDVNRWLVVRVEAPQQISAVEWNTRGYDWQALGSASDRVLIPGPVDPTAYRQGGEMEDLLAFATDQIDRHKVQVELPGMSVERSGNQLWLKGFQRALQPLIAHIRLGGEDGTIMPGEVVELSVDNPRISRPLAFNEAIGAFSYSYLDDQQLERTVYIENSSSFAHKLSLLERYGVTQVMVRDTDSGDVDPALWEMAGWFQLGEGFATGPAELAITYTITHPDGYFTQETRPINDPALTFTAPDGEGDVRVEAQVVQNNSPASPRNVVALSLATPTPIATATPVPTATPSVPRLTSAQTINIREGPGTNYPRVGQVTANRTYVIVGKNEAGDWWQIEMSDGNKGWVFAQLTTAGGPLNQVATITDIPDPPPVAVSAPAASAPAPSGGGGFGYGVQAHMVHNNQAGQVMQKTREMGFGWVKQQIEWYVFEPSPGDYQWGAMQGIIDAANGAGISLLFSTVNAPPWAREPGFDGNVGGPPQDPDTFARFLGAMAGKYCGSSLKAIEVWNEQNLHYEWGNRQINPSEYMNLLRPAYAAIKGACPSMLVISGALTPAGDNGNLAMDDFRYFETMLQQGLANYADGFGAHPSGYNVPPNHRSDTACQAIQVSGHRFNGACDNPHHSWSFLSTMEGYRNLAVRHGAGNRRIWPTEFGWAAGGTGILSTQLERDQRAYADDNSFEEQAQWTVDAYQWMRNQGWVGPAILWNLNFRVVANGTEKALWGIVDPNWGNLPVFNALRDMPK